MIAQICTTKEQSERLLALGISNYTADMPLQEYINPETEKEAREIAKDVCKEILEEKRKQI